MAISVSGAEVPLDEARLQAFAAQLRGESIRPGDATYDEARQVWNGMIDRYPSFAPLK
ncbi:MAG: hypothetical protein M3220_22600 [Chloroflexota bacterium]|nr:hypothetical protein [Chloroflexota bacterium]